MTKRALSLDDLVNHDENDKMKLQKMGEDNLPADNVAAVSTVHTNSNSPSIPANKMATPSMNISILNDDKPISAPNTAGSDSVSTDGSRQASNERNDDDETDTDDELGTGGEVNFDNGMTFDYDKQDKDSPKKRPTPAKRADSKKDLNKDVKLEQKEDTIPDAVKTAAKDSIKLNDTKQRTVKEDDSVTKIFEEKTSSVSKRNNVKKDLQVLGEISTSSKPNKYKNVPIWAQKWKPTVNALQNIDTKDFKIDSSFLNIIPDDDLTKSVQDWIYATIYSIPPDVRQFIELEMKFGLIKDAKGPDRISPPISSQAVYTELDAHLTPNIDEVLFTELNKYIHNVSDLSENSGKFSVIESLTKDSVYRVGLTTQRPRFLRMSTDVKTGRIGDFIEKRKVAQLLLYSPKDSYDVKISLNLELPVPENDPPEKFLSQTPISERTKDRISYIHNDSCARIDITKVQNHNQGVKGKHIETTHEIELEINTQALLSAFNNIAHDSKEYASVIRTFLNNGTIIRRKLSSLSYDIFEGQKK